ncbi:MAG: plasmid stabilization protein [Deltaproteobacteria bacterium]|nr:plasmid stabilization protein [Deltaproteobacteria bacterium]
MARGSKKSYTSKQKRMARHIEESEKTSGKSSKRAASIAYATVNKKDGGGKQNGSGRKKSSRSRSKK